MKSRGGGGPIKGTGSYLVYKRRREEGNNKRKSGSG